DSNTSFSVSITPLSAAFTGIGDSVILGGIIPGETVHDSIYFTLDPSVQSGTTLSYIINLNDGSKVQRDTISKIFGQPVVLFNDICSNLGNWTPGGWGISTSSFHSAPASITDSPNGNYQDNTNKSITLTTAVDMTTAVYGVLSFWAKWDIESGYDYTQVKISTNGGSTWTPLAGNYTHPGTSYQDPGNPVYDGQQLTWVLENIDLTPYLGHAIKLRFTIISDGNVTGDGFYFDDISVTTIGAPTGHMVSGLISYANTTSTPLSGVQLNLKNTQGTVVSSAVTDGSGSYSFSGIADGSYTIEASTTKPWGGATAADVLLYKKHIAGIAALSGIYLASGDVNGNGSITASDVLLIRKRIISIITSFPVGDWLFNPQPVTVSGGNVTQSFNGLTYGDANASYQPVSLKNTSIPVDRKGGIHIVATEPAADRISVPVQAFDLSNLGSFQFTIQYDPQKLIFQTISDLYPGFESIMVGNPKPGVLSFVWAADEQGMNILSGTIFNLQFKTSSLQPSELTFSDHPATAEFGDFDGHIFLPELKSGSIGQAVNDLFSVFPNPNRGIFTITGTSTGQMSIIVKDLVGNEIYHQQNQFINAGQGFRVDLGSLAEGIYLLTVEEGSQKFTKKIVILQ
ncbi:MAG: T9SS type A sorting domain-containing protein, partial [Bacteroidota bacterium]